MYKSADYRTSLTLEIKPGGLKIEMKNKRQTNEVLQLFQVSQIYEQKWGCVDHMISVYPLHK